MLPNSFRKEESWPLFPDVLRQTNTVFRSILSVYCLLLLCPQIENHLAEEVFLAHTTGELESAQLASVHMMREHEDVLVPLVSELSEVVERLVEI